MKDEIESIAQNQVWDLIELPQGASIISCKWVYKMKRDFSDKIEWYKVRLIAKNFIQKESIDYHKTFSLVSKKDSLNIVMTLVAHFDLKLYQMDVKNNIFEWGSRRDNVHDSTWRFLYR